MEHRLSWRLHFLSLAIELVHAEPVVCEGLLLHRGALLRPVEILDVKAVIGEGLLFSGGIGGLSAAAHIV